MTEDRFRSIVEYSLPTQVDKPFGFDSELVASIVQHDRQIDFGRHKENPHIAEWFKNPPAERFNTENIQAALSDMQERLLEEKDLNTRSKIRLKMIENFHTLVDNNNPSLKRILEAAKEYGLNQAINNVDLEDYLTERDCSLNSLDYAVSTVIIEEIIDGIIDGFSQPKPKQNFKNN